MRKACPETSINNSRVLHFTPDSFFAAAATPRRTNAATMVTPKRPPKLMDQRVEMPKRSGRQSAKQLPRPKQTTNEGGAAAEMLRNTNFMFATPQRRAAYQQQIRREQSASIIIPSRQTLSATFMRYTPPTTFAEDREVATVFAGSKFIESPSAKSLPQPPSHWLGGNQRLNISTERKIDEEMPMSSDESVFHGSISASEANENFVPGNWSPPAPSTTSNSGEEATKSPSGVRMHPLHLIAATVMST